MNESCMCCSAIWGFDEMQFQQCSACGWSSDQDPEQYMSDHPEYFGEDEDWEFDDLDNELSYEDDSN